MSTEVRINAEGVEVARWLANRGPVRLWQDTVLAPGIYLVYCHAPIYVDYEDVLGLPTLGSASIGFVIGAELLGDLDPNTSTADLAAISTVRVDDKLGGLLSRAEKLQIEVER